MRSARRYRNDRGTRQRQHGGDRCRGTLGLPFEPRPVRNKLRHGDNDGAVLGHKRQTEHPPQLRHRAHTLACRGCIIHCIGARNPGADDARFHLRGGGHRRRSAVFAGRCALRNFCRHLACHEHRHALDRGRSHAARLLDSVRCDKHRAQLHSNIRQAGLPRAEASRCGDSDGHSHGRSGGAALCDRQREKEYHPCTDRRFFQEGYRIFQEVPACLCPDNAQ